jgi:hypothetical protein
MTKHEAFKRAKELRAEGRTVKVVLVQGVATVPGRGLEPVRYYDVRDAEPCGSGWTNDRCTKPLGHSGRHSNE